MKVHQTIGLDEFVEDDNFAGGINIIRQGLNCLKRSDLCGESADFNIHLLEDEIIFCRDVIASCNNSVALAGLAGLVESGLGSDIFCTRQEGDSGDGGIISKAAVIAPYEDTKENVYIGRSGDLYLLVDCVERTIVVHRTDCLRLNVHASAVTAVDRCAGSEENRGAHSTENHHKFFNFVLLEFVYVWFLSMTLPKFPVFPAIVPPFTELRKKSA